MLYGWKNWYDNETISRCVRVFENKALRRIMGVRWQDHVPNDDVRDASGVAYVDEYLMAKRWRWLGTLCMREMGELYEGLSNGHPPEQEEDEDRDLRG